jgi:hypothetical protein
VLAKFKLVEAQQQEHPSARGNPANSIRRGWVGSLHYSTRRHAKKWLTAGAEDAFAELEAAAQVLFSRLQDRLHNPLPHDHRSSSSSSSSTPVVVPSGPARIKHVEVHLLPPGNHSYELAYTSRDPQAYTGLYVVQAGAKAEIAFSDPRGDLPSIPQVSAAAETLTLPLTLPLSTLPLLRTD